MNLMTKVGRTRLQVYQPAPATIRPLTAPPQIPQPQELSLLLPLHQQLRLKPILIQTICSCALLQQLVLHLLLYLKQPLQFHQPSTGRKQAAALLTNSTALWAMLVAAAVAICRLSHPTVVAAAVTAMMLAVPLMALGMAVATSGVWTGTRLRWRQAAAASAAAMPLVTHRLLQAPAWRLQAPCHLVHHPAMVTAQPAEVHRQWRRQLGAWRSCLAQSLVVMCTGL